MAWEQALKCVWMGTCCATQHPLHALCAPQILNPILPWICLCFYRGFQQVPQAWHFLSCTSSDPPHFPHFSWLTAGREGAGAGIGSSTPWLEKSSELRKRESLQLLFFLPLQWKQLWGVNYFVQIGVPVKFCTTTCLNLKADRDQLKQKRKKMCTDKTKKTLTFKRLWSWGPSTLERGSAVWEGAAAFACWQHGHGRKLGLHPAKLFLSK